MHNGNRGYRDGRVFDTGLPICTNAGNRESWGAHVVALCVCTEQLLRAERLHHATFRACAACYRLTSWLVGYGGSMISTIVQGHVTAADFCFLVAFILFVVLAVIALSRSAVESVLNHVALAAIALGLLLL